MSANMRVVILHEYIHSDFAYTRFFVGKDTLYNYIDLSIFEYVLWPTLIFVHIVSYNIMS
jgi:hypothetical protein